MSTPVGPGQLASRMGIQSGFLVLERGFGDDADEEYKEKDLAFIGVARMAMDEGFEVYYDSWW